MNDMERLLAAGQLPQAKTEAEKLLASDPANRDALLVLAKVALVEGKLPEAESHVTKAEAKGATVDTLLVRANLAAQKGQLDAALEAYQKVLAKAPERAEAHFGRGMMLVKQGKLQPALEALSMAAQLEPANAVFRFRLGLAQLEAGKDEQGLASLRQLVAEQPRFVLAHLSLANALAARDDLPGAKSVLEQALEKVPRHPRLLALLTVVNMALRDVKASYKAASALAAQSPKDANAQANFALLMLARGQYQRVLHLCRAMESAGLANEALKMAEATCYEAEEPPAFDKAVAAYEAAMRLAPEGWRAANNLGQLLLRIPAGSAEPHLQRAIAVLEEAVRRAPKQPEPRLNLALALARAGEKAKAGEQVKQLLALPLSESDPSRQQAVRLEQALARG